MSIDELIINPCNIFFNGRTRAGFWSWLKNDSELIYNKFVDIIENSDKRIVTMDLKDVKGMDYKFIEDVFIKLLKFMKEVYKGDRALIFGESYEKSINESLNFVFGSNDIMAVSKNDRSLSLIGKVNDTLEVILAELIKMPIKSKINAETLRYKIGLNRDDFYRDLSEFESLGLVRKDVDDLYVLPFDLKEDCLGYYQKL